MALQLDFSSAEEQRVKITQQQQEYISNLYRQAAKEVYKLAERAPRVSSDAIRQQYLNTLQGQIEDQLKDIEGQLSSEIRSGMSSVAKATVADAKTFLKESGLPIKGAYSHVPADIVQSVASGQLYSGNWTLSRALWLNTQETQQEVQSIVAQGIIQNKSAYDIAKDLEKYVDPTARKDWDWSKVYPGTRKVVDYNAQRLARTMVSHAYQQAFVRTTRKNPFVTKYKWEASNSDRMCEICQERDGKLFDKDDLPLDHPNGMCTFTAVMDNLETIGERLGDWAAGKEDPELDKWAEDLYGKGWEQNKQDVESYGVTGRDITDTWERRSEEFAFEIEDVINAQGFDGLPRVVSADEFDKYVQDSGFIMQRSYKASSQEILDSYREQLYYGKWYVDCSTGGCAYGQGMYAAGYMGTEINNWLSDQMTVYGNKSDYAYTETMTFAKNSRIVSLDELGNIRERTLKMGAESYLKNSGLTQDQQSFLKLFSSGLLDVDYSSVSETAMRLAQAGLMEETQNEARKFGEFISKRRDSVSDDGVLAAMNGYDAIEVNRGEGNYYVVLNRTRVVIKKGD